MRHQDLTPDPEQLIAIANQLINSNQKQQALQLLVTSCNQNPKSDTLSLTLARLLHQHGQNNDAIHFLNKTYKLGSQNIELLYMLSALLHVEKKFKDTETILKQLLVVAPESAAAHNLLGANYVELNRYDEAVSAYLTSIQLKPTSADAYNNLAWAYRAMGKKQDAIANFEKAFEVDPTATEALGGLLLLKTFNKREKEFDLVEKCLKNTSLSSKQKTDLAFALGKAYEDIKDFRNAFSYFKHANNIWRKNLNYDIAEDETLFLSLKDLFTETPAINEANNSIANNLQPIFILGMPRSSTTLIEQIISSHSQVIGGGELPFLENILMGQNKTLKWHSTQTREEQNQMANSYYESLNQHISTQIHSDSRYVTDKLPLNFRFIGAILHLFPKAKIIHCKRNAMDTCLSLFKHHFPMANHGYSYNLKELGQYYNLYEDLMSYWHAIAPGKILDVQYEDLLNNFDQQVETMLEFCELNFESACKNFQKNKRVVRTASSDQVRQGLYKSAAGRWQMYEEELAELKSSLQSYS